MIDRPLLSVIVTSYTIDRMKDIYELLDSIKVQTYSNIEVVFVGERSAELCENVKLYAWKKEIANTMVIFNGVDPGLSASRNAGIKQAQGDIIAFVDDDVILFPDWAEKMVMAYKDDSVIGVTGPALPLWKDKVVSWFPEEFYWVISCTGWCNLAQTMEVRNGWGHSMSFRKEAFTYCRFEDTFGRTKGFDKGGKKGPVGDDTEFCINLKTKSGKAIIYNPTVKVYHKVYSYRLTPSFIRRQAYWQGYTKAMFKRIYNKGEKGEKVLDTEYQLLRRILFNLFPGIVGEFFHHPKMAWKRLHLSITVLLHLVIGYLSATCSGFGTLTRKAYGA